MGDGGWFGELGELRRCIGVWRGGAGGVTTLQHARRGGEGSKIYTRYHLKSTIKDVKTETNSAGLYFVLDRVSSVTTKMGNLIKVYEIRRT